MTAAKNPSSKYLFNTDSNKMETMNNTKILKNQTKIMSKTNQNIKSSPDKI